MVERDIGNRQAAAAPDDGQRGRIMFWIGGKHHADHLRLVQVPSGNSGRIGRSIMRLVRISFSEGRPSRLMKPPGISRSVSVLTIIYREREKSGVALGSSVEQAVTRTTDRRIGRSPRRSPVSPSSRLKGNRFAIQVDIDCIYHLGSPPIGQRCAGALRQ